MGNVRNIVGRNAGALGSLAFCFLGACLATAVEQPRVVGASVAPEMVDEPVQPLPTVMVLDEAKVRLGARLFQEPRLSLDGTISCASCHPLERAGVDGLSHSPRAGGGTTALNTPTVFNAAFNFRFNWSGVYTSLEDALDAPIARALTTTVAEIVSKLQADPSYVAEFAAIYPEGVTAASYKNAAVEHLKSLFTPNARFDRYLRGDATALTPEEQRGYQLFKERGCVTCHQGRNVGGNMYQRMGVMKDYLPGHTLSGAELGLFSETHDESHRQVFRVPSLRNVARTAPYFHDGSAPGLEDAVAAMGRYQLGLTLPPQDIRLLVAFLGTLTGEYQRRPL